MFNILYSGYPTFLFWGWGFNWLNKILDCSFLLSYHKTSNIKALSVYMMCLVLNESVIFLFDTLVLKSVLIFVAPISSWLYPVCFWLRPLLRPLTVSGQSACATRDLVSLICCLTICRLLCGADYRRHSQFKIPGANWVCWGRLLRGKVQVWLQS